MQASTLIISPRLRTPAGGLEFNGRSYRGGSYLPNAARSALEAVATKAALVAKSEPVMIGIMGFCYQVQPIAINPSVGAIAFSLHDVARNQLHHVHKSIDGEVICDCADFIYRRSATGQSCKHGRRLAELGLIASTTPRILPPFADRKPKPQARPSHRTRFEPSRDEVAEAAALFGWRAGR